MLIGRFARFTLVGALATGIQYLILFALVEYLAANPVLASSVGFVVSALANYSLNYRYTFRSNRPHAPALLKFMILAGVGLGLNSSIMGTLMEAGLHYLIAQVFATGVVLLWNFTGNSLWTFR